MFSIQPHNFLQFSSTALETKHPIRLYSRYIDSIHIMFRALDFSVLRPP